MKENQSKVDQFLEKIREKSCNYVRGNYKPEVKYDVYNVLLLGDKESGKYKMIETWLNRSKDDEVENDESFHAQSKPVDALSLNITNIHTGCYCYSSHDIIKNDNVKCNVWLKGEKKVQTLRSLLHGSHLAYGICLLWLSVYNPKTIKQLKMELNRQVAEIRSMNPCVKFTVVVNYREYLDEKRQDKIRKILKESISKTHQNNLDLINIYPINDNNRHFHTLASAIVQTYDRRMKILSENSET